MASETFSVDYFGAIDNDGCLQSRETSQEQGLRVVPSQLWWKTDEPLVLKPTARWQQSGPDWWHEPQCSMVTCPFGQGPARLPPPPHTHTQGRWNRGKWGQLAPPTWKLWERRPPQLWTVDVVQFYFVSVFARELADPPLSSGYPIPSPLCHAPVSRVWWTSSTGHVAVTEPSPGSGGQPGLRATRAAWRRWWQPSKASLGHPGDVHFGLLKPISFIPWH